MGRLPQDLRFAARSLRRYPGFAVTAILCLALGIAANTTVFSLVNAFLLRPLPYPDADRIVFLSGESRAQGVTDAGVSIADVRDWRERSRLLEDVAAFSSRSLTLTGGDLPERVEGGSITPNLFPMLGVQPQLGRHFLPEEARPMGLETVVLLSDRIWRRQYGADPEILGRPVHVNGLDRTVVGVMPPDFEFPESEEIWLPYDPPEGASRAGRGFLGVAKLREGVSMEAAQREIDSISEELAAAHPETNAGWSARLMTFRDRMIGDISSLFWLMLGSVAFVLLIACANVANLLLARSAARGRELAIRSALGAGRGRLVRQMLTESVLLSLVAGALGALGGALWLRAIVASIPERLPYWMRLEVDGAVLGYTLAVSLFTALAFGVLPALRASRPELQASLRDGGRGLAGGVRDSRTRSFLVAGEIALSLVLLVGATLMIQSFLRLHGEDAGFETDRLLTMRLYLAGDEYDPIDAKAAFFQEVEERLAALPGVESAVSTTSIPTDDGGANLQIVAEGHAPLPGEETVARAFGSTPGLFRTLQIPLLAGRGFTAREATDANATVVVLNETLAERLWPGEAAVGRRVRLGRGADAPLFTVVGVAPEVHYEEVGEATTESRLQVHLPYAQMGAREMAILVRVRGDPAPVAAEVRREIRALDPALPLFDVRTMEQVRSFTLWPQRLIGSVFGAFASLALVLAVIGIYGVMAYGVSQRGREIGIRMALGAGAGDVIRLVLGQAVRITVAGLAVGAIAALATARLLSGSLYGVSASDPLTFATMPVLLGVAALLASYLPARRATRVDPMTAMRAD